MKFIELKDIQYNNVIIICEYRIDIILFLAPQLLLILFTHGSTLTISCMQIPCFSQAIFTMTLTMLHPPLLFAHGSVHVSIMLLTPYTSLYNIFMNRKMAKNKHLIY